MQTPHLTKPPPYKWIKVALLKKIQNFHSMPISYFSVLYPREIWAVTCIVRGDCMRAHGKFLYLIGCVMGSFRI